MKLSVTDNKIALSNILTNSKSDSLARIQIWFLQISFEVHTHKKGAPIQGDLGGTQEMTVINESGLYSLILSSKLPNDGLHQKFYLL